MLSSDGYGSLSMEKEMKKSLVAKSILLAVVLIITAACSKTGSTVSAGKAIKSA